MILSALLHTEDEAAEITGVTVEEFRRWKIKPAGSYAPPRSKVIPLYARSEVERRRGHVG